MVESTIKHTPVQSTLGCNQAARITNIKKLQTHRGGAPRLSLPIIIGQYSVLYTSKISKGSTYKLPYFTSNKRLFTHSFLHSASIYQTRNITENNQGPSSPQTQNKVHNVDSFFIHQWLRLTQSKLEILIIEATGALIPPPFWLE